MHFTPSPTNHHCPSHTHHHRPSHTHYTPPTAVLYAPVHNSSVKKTENEKASCNIWCSSCGRLRYILVILALLGNCLDYMLRFNLSTAIVSMVNVTDAQVINTTMHTCPAASNATSDVQTTKGGGVYNWTPKEQGLVLGMFFWGYLFTKMMGGRIAELVGPHLTVAVTTCICGVLTLLTPTVADLSVFALAALRLAMGLLQGPIFPALYSLVSRWAPHGETGMMVSVTVSGLCVGLMLSQGVSGMVIKAFGWRWVFWGGGLVTLMWIPFWLIFVRDNPKHHPGISRKELSLLSENRNQPRRRAPWSRIFKSRQLYLFILMEFANVWSQGVVIMEGPTFLTTQIGLDLQLTGAVGLLLSGISFVMSFVYGWLTDLIMRKEWLQPVNIRRLIQGIGLGIFTVSFGGVLMAGCYAPAVVASLTMSGLAITANIVTYNLGPMDIAPNYAGTLSGLVGLGTMAGFLSPMFTSYFSNKENGWTIVFATTLGLNVFASLLYITCVSTSEVEWNKYEEISGDEQATTGQDS